MSKTFKFQSLEIHSKSIQSSNLIIFELLLYGSCSKKTNGILELKIN